MTPKDLKAYEDLIATHKDNVKVQAVAKLIDQGRCSLIGGLCLLVSYLVMENERLMVDATLELHRHPLPPLVIQTHQYDGWSHADAIDDLKRRFGGT
jgi:hypothetical protein